MTLNANVAIRAKDSCNWCCCAGAKVKESRKLPNVHSETEIKVTTVYTKTHRTSPEATPPPGSPVAPLTREAPPFPVPVSSVH